MHMARTTLVLDDDLLKRLKETAARKGTTLAALVNGLLRHSMVRKPNTRPFKLEMNGWEAEIQPGVDILDRDSLFDLMDGR